MDEDKKYIIKLFNENVKGVIINTDNQNNKHCGKEGFWLENKMGILHNCKNEPDIRGYEMKKSFNKITLGDFSASEYAFSPKNKRHIINEYNDWTDEDIKINKKEFIEYFGNPNPNKNNRYSWSGSCIPIYNKWNYCGQNLIILENNDIIIYYSYSKDTRERKSSYPDFIKKDNLVIAIWKGDKMSNHINNKFNQKGFFICQKTTNTFDKISFGKPFDFNYFIECIKNNKIYFDSGMYQGNSRNYSHFRASKTFWNDLIIEEY